MEEVASRKVKPVLILALALASMTGALPVRAQRAPRLSVIEHITTALERDKGFSRAERRDMIAALRSSFADYALQIIPGRDPASIRVVMRMIIEGHFDSAPKERIAEVAFAAYQAISRGAPADVAEGIALYGYRKKIPADRIGVWANGYHQLVESKVPGPVAADLVRNAMEHDWEDGTFNTFKWALVRGLRDGFDIEDYAAYLFGHMQEGKRGPGRLTADARAYFKKMARSGRKPKLPPYEGVFSRTQDPEPVYEVVPETPREEPAPAPVPPPAKVQPAEPEARPAEPPPEPRKAPKTKVRPRRRKLDLTIGQVWPGLDKSSKSYLGTPYVWGGTTRKGIDCSALTRNTYRENKIAIPRVSRQQWKAGKKIKKSRLRKGDLVFFNTQGVGVSHVGMVVQAKPTRFIHASSSRGVVVDKLSKRWFKQRFLGARRIVP